MKKSGQADEAGLSQTCTQRVLSGMLALIEAQHNYYVHIMHGKQFARDMGELGSRNEAGGTVMMMDVWNANADALNAPLEGYCFKVLPYDNGQGEQDGFAVAAFTCQVEAGGKVLPVFLALVKSGRGGLLRMTSVDTWEVRDAELTQRLRSVLHGHAKLDDTVVSVYAPAPDNSTRTFHQFSTDSPQ